MSIQKFSGPKSNKGLDVAMGFATGGPAGAGMALLKDSNPALGAIGGMMGKGSAPSAPETYNPMQQLQSNMEQNPEMLRNQALEAYKDPQVYAQLDGATVVPQLLNHKYKRNTV